MTMVSAQGDGSIPSIRQLKKLLKVYSKNLRRHPNDLDLRTKLAEVLRLLDRRDEAIALYSSVAWAHGVAGHLGQAVMLCKIILQLNPDHSETQQMLAKLYASQRIRQAKQSVPVVKVDGRWVADPRGSNVSQVEVSETREEPADDRPPDPASLEADGSERLDLRDEDADDRPPDPASLEADGSERLDLRHGDAPYDDKEEPTRDESPSNPEMVARRARAPTPPPAELPSSELPTPKERPGPADLLLPEPLDEPGLQGSIKADPEGKERGPFAKANTILKDRVVVTADEEGQLVVDPAAGKDGSAKPTMQLSPTKVEEVAAKVPSPDPALGPRISSDETTHMVPVPDDSREPAKREEDVAEEEPTQLEEERITEKSGPQRLPHQPTPAVSRAVEIEPARPGVDPHKTHEVQDIDVVSEEPTEIPRDEADTDVVLDGETQDAAAGREARSVPEAIQRVLGPEDASARPADRRISTGQLTTAGTPDTGADTAGPSPVDYASSGELATGVQEEPPPIPDDAGEDESRATGEAERPLTTTGMMDKLSSTLPSRPSARYEHKRERESESESAAEPVGGPPDPGEVEMVATGDVDASPVRQLHRRTTPGFLSAVDREKVGQDPIQLLRTTRRYGTVETGRPARDTLVDQIDPSLVSGVMRMDQQAAQAGDDSNKGYATIQKEVRAAGRQQDDREPDADEQAEAERSILDTLRDLPREEELDLDQGLPRTPFPLFSDLDTPAFLAMVEKLERRVCDSGSLVFQEGDPGDSLFLVSSGNLEVLKRDDKERLVKLARLGPGSFFGEFALLTDRRRHASVRCIDECELLELRRETLLELIRVHPSVSWTLRTFYQQRLMAMVLATSPLFQAVSPEDRRAVLARFAIKRIIAGETIIEEGRPGTGFYIILVGEVGVSCLADDGTEVPLGKLSEGDYFGEISLLTGTAAEATVRANAITEVLTLGANDFYDLASAHPEIWAEVQGEAERRQRETADRLAEQARQVKAAGPLCLI